jgi:hypothetical protein
MNAPIPSFRNASNPATVITSLNSYTETIANQSGLPTLAGDNSISTIFRIYNNYGGSSNIAAMQNVTITTYDGVSAISHTATTLPIIQEWLYFAENGFGENSSYNVLYTYYTDDSIAVGGTASTKTFTYGSDGSSSSQIRAGSSGNGTGMIEVQTLAQVPSVSSTATYNFGISVSYFWSS